MTTNDARLSDPPAMSAAADLRLLAINLTKRCNLACAHCYLDAQTQRHGARDELDTTSVCETLDEVKRCGNGTMVVLTGGEPLMRPDIESIIAHGSRLGLAMVVGTNGMMLTERRVESLQNAGLLGVGISVDSLDPEFHDGFRGLPGAWARTMAGIEVCRRTGLAFQIHFSVMQGNVHELPAMIEFCRTVGAKVLNVFFLVCTGRGESLSDITPERYERALGELIDAQAEVEDLIIRARCAPHFKRVAFERNPESRLNRIAGSEGDGCLAGTHYCRITPNGDVTACPYIPTAVGNVREHSFAELWATADDFQRLRHPTLGGTCGACEFRKLCGGCRARAIAAGHDLLDEDPWCGYTPQGGPVIEPLTEVGAHVTWSESAQRRLERIPAMLRPMVKKRAEAYVAELGEAAVTADHLAVLSARRFGGKPPFARRRS